MTPGFVLSVHRLISQQSVGEVPRGGGRTLRSPLLCVHQPGEAEDKSAGCGFITPRDEGSKLPASPGPNTASKSPALGGTHVDPHARSARGEGQSLPCRHVMSRRGDTGSEVGPPAGSFLGSGVHCHFILWWWRRGGLGLFIFHLTLRCSHVAVANHTTQVFNVLGAARGEGCTVPPRPGGTSSDPGGRHACRHAAQKSKQMKSVHPLGGGS